MPGKLRPIIAIHESGHAVIARSLGADVVYVSARSTAQDNAGVVPVPSQARLAKDQGVAARVVGYEKDAKIALAGLAAQRRAYPGTVPEVLDEDEGDVINAWSAAGRAATLE